MKKSIKFLLCTLMACFIFAFSAGAAEYKGIDVSHYNGSVDWQRVSQSQQFAYVKATEGEHTNDILFKQNATQLSSANIDWGAYHFFRCYGVESAKKQAQFFYNKIKGTGYTLRPALDVETADGVQSAKEIRSMITAFCDEFKRLSGEAPILYSYTSYIKQYGLEKLNMTLWQADYRGKCENIGLKPSIWQYSYKGKVAGLTSKYVDLNTMYDRECFLSKAIKQVTQSIAFAPSVNSRAGKQFTVLNAQGVPQTGHLVFKGDKLKIVGVSDYNKQLLKVEYPVRNYWVTGYVSNDEAFLHNYGFNNWRNGSTSEPVYNAAGSRIGTIFPYEYATILGKASNGYTAVLYETGKGKETKSGFVRFGGIK